jgi:transcriptional regulator with XRE-family HTH domain
MATEVVELMSVVLAHRLVTIRKQRGMTQQALADEVGVHVTQLRRYEAGTAQPTADVVRRLAIALRTSADSLLFEENERGPDEDLRLQFEAVSRLDPEEKRIVREVVESLIMKHDARRWFQVG